MEYDQANNEHLFTGIVYKCYENGNSASYYMVKDGIKNGEMVRFIRMVKLKSLNI